jgi:hypothetical protein
MCFVAAVVVIEHFSNSFQLDTEIKTHKYKIEKTRRDTNKMQNPRNNLQLFAIQRSSPSSSSSSSSSSLVFC